MTAWKKLDKKTILNHDKYWMKCHLRDIFVENIT